MDSTLPQSSKTDGPSVIERTKNDTGVVSTNPTDKVNNSGHDGHELASNDMPPVETDNLSQTSTNEEDNHNTPLLKLEPYIVSHFDQSPVPSGLHSTIDSDDDRTTPQSPDLVKNDRPRLSYREGYPYFSDLEEKCRAQFRPSPSTTDRIEFLYTNQWDFPAELFNDEIRLSPSRWLWGKRLDLPLDVLEHLKEENIIAAQEDMQSHKERLNAKVRQPTNMDVDIVQNFIDDVLLDVPDEERDIILILRGFPMEGILEHIPENFAPNRHPFRQH